MAKKKEENKENGSILDKIISTTDFESLSGGNIKTFTQRDIVPTPVKAIDGLIGGGIPLGTIVDLFGPKGSGKSSFGYELMGNFQKRYPEGQAMLIDTESSADDLRVEQLGCDPSKILTLRGNTLEQGYKQILSVLKTVIECTNAKERPKIFIMWDSLSAAATDAQTEKENPLAGGISEAARINKEYLKQIYALVSQVDVMIVLINQVSAKIGSYVPGFNEAGGNALQHAVHFKLEFSESSVDKEQQKASILGMAIETNAKVKITKNKLGPVSSWYPITIDNTMGGIINQAKSFIDYIEERDGLGILEKSGSRYAISPDFLRENPLTCQYIEKKYPVLMKSFYYKTFVEAVETDLDENGILFDSLLLGYVNIIGSVYSLQRKVIAPYKKELESKIKEYTQNQGWDLDYIPTGEIEED